MEVHPALPQKRFTIEDFEYELPAELIAQVPAERRDGSRLMSLSRQVGNCQHLVFRDIVQLLQSGDVLVLNDTKVMPTRIRARRVSGGAVEILLLRPAVHQPGLWHAMASPMRKLKVGDELLAEGISGRQHSVFVRDFTFAEDGQRRLLLDIGLGSNVYELLRDIGHAPLPPYIRRNAAAIFEQDEADLARYQTVFANEPGAVAAPTAGLHFTEELLAQLQKQGVEIRFLTLHVGPGTFKPISDSLERHAIEGEIFSIPESTVVSVNAALDEGRRIIAVGTTSCRALETAGQSGRLQAAQQATSSLYIQPGYKFKIVKAMVTNFHLSRSSLLVMIAAFAGYEPLMKAYQEAVRSRYRFFSYGDAMFIY